MGEHYRCGDVCHPSMPPWENAVHFLKSRIAYSIITLITIIVTITITFINIIITIWFSFVVFLLKLGWNSAFAEVISVAQLSSDRGRGVHPLINYSAVAVVQTAVIN